MGNGSVVTLARSRARRECGSSQELARPARESSDFAECGALAQWAMNAKRPDLWSQLPAELVCKIKGYRLPCDPSVDQLFVPCSGGIDSSALAIVLSTLFPEAEIRFPFTDTKDEDPSVQESLEALEDYLGHPIDRIDPGKGLYELIDDWGGLLPSPTARFCTRRLKSEPFEEWLKLQPAAKGGRFVFTGIRADEADRLALTMPGFETVFPFIEMGITRADVATIMRASIGIPGMYRRRVRSGCTSCFFQRRQELVGLLQESPVQFQHVASVEKLGEADKHRHKPAPYLPTEVGVTRNHLALPMPNSDDISKLRGSKRGSDLFGQKGIFAVVEFFFDSFCGINPFCWHQRVVSYSTTLAGAKEQADGRYQHLLMCGEVYDMSPDEVRANARFAVYFLQAPEEELDTHGPSKGSYTWQAGQSLAQIRHCTTWAERILWIEAARREAGNKNKHRATSYEYESAELCERMLNGIMEERGECVASAWYSPKEPDPKAVETRASRVPCPMCSV